MLISVVIADNHGLGDLDDLSRAVKERGPKGSKLVKAFALRDQKRELFRIACGRAMELLTHPQAKRGDTWKARQMLAEIRAALVAAEVEAWGEWRKLSQGERDRISDGKAVATTGKAV